MLSTNPHTILVVDDDEAKRYTVCRLLKREGYGIIEAATGEEALAVASSARPDLVVLDVNLPDLDGFEVCRRLKSSPLTAYILVLHLTASFSGSENRTKGLDLGADGYLSQDVEPAEFLATVRSLLRIRQAEGQARTLAKQWQATFDAISDGVCLVGLDGRVSRCNAGLTSLLKRPNEEILGLALNDLARGLGLDEFPDLATLLGEPHRYVSEQSANGRWFRLTADPVREEADRVTGIVILVSDVSERRRIEEALRVADRRKDEFLATLAHELRNPLAPIRSGLQILTLSDSPTAVAKVRDIIGRQVGQMVRLIDDLLDVSRFNSGKVDLQISQVDLRLVIDAAVETSRPLFETAGHEFSVDMPSTPILIRCDPTRLAQVLSNLLNNAAKYTPNGGRIELSATLVDGTATIRVVDNGVGIAPESLTNVFDLFSQVDRSLERSQGGLGIGLSLVKRLVELHGGTVSVESAGLGFGSTFTVRIPTAQPERPAARIEPPATPVAPQPVQRRILVVDDNKDAAETLAFLLQIAGHDVRVAHAGQAAIETARAFNPEMIFLDIGLPGMNGYEVAKALRSHESWNGAVLVALTGWGAEDDRRQSGEAGFDHHVTKPIEFEMLQTLLSSLRS